MMFLMVKSLHIIFMVAWFSGLFYLPRLFVYHAQAKDKIGIERFKIMERRLYYAITWPAAVMTSIFGTWLVAYNYHYYLHAPWMHVKLLFVVLLWGYHLASGHYLKLFSQDNNHRTSKFFRIYNEIPTILLVVIVMMVVVRPFSAL